MHFFKILLISLLLGGGTIFAGYATIHSLGAQEVKYPQAVSLRQESIHTRNPAMRALYLGGRSHRGGGISRGK